MPASAPPRDRLHSVLTRERRAFKWQAFGRALGISVMLLPLGALIARIGDVAAVAALGSASAMALTWAAFSARRRAAAITDCELCSAVDARLHGHGVLVSLRQSHEASLWWPLVEAQAQKVLTQDRGPLRPKLSVQALLRIMLCLGLTACITFWSVGSNEDAPQAGETLLAAEPSSPTTSPTEPFTTQSAVDPMGRLTLSADAVRLSVGSDSKVRWRYEPQRPSLQPLAMHCLALVRDQERSEDFGFGAGAKPWPLDAVIELGPDGPHGVSAFEDSLRRWIEGACGEVSGSFKVSVLGLARRADGTEIQWQSPEIAIEVDAPATAVVASASKPAAVEMQPTEAPAGQDKPRRGVGGDGRDVAMGDAEELGRARLHAKAVKPLLASAATRKKEVEVFERSAAPVTPREKKHEPFAEARAGVVLPVNATSGLRAEHDAESLRVIDEYFRSSAASGR